MAKYIRIRTATADHCTLTNMNEELVDLVMGHMWAAVVNTDYFVPTREQALLAIQAMLGTGTLKLTNSRAAPLEWRIWLKAGSDFEEYFYNNDLVIKGQGLEEKHAI